MNQRDLNQLKKKQLSKFDRTVLCRKQSLNEIGTHGEKHEITTLKIMRLLRGQKTDIKANFRLVEFLNILEDKKIECYTEMFSLDRKHKADLVALTYPVPTIIEISDTETESEIGKKKKYWCKKGFNFLVVRI